MDCDGALASDYDDTAITDGDSDTSSQARGPADTRDCNGSQDDDASAWGGHVLDNDVDAA